jgi:hypothetical protein
MIASAEIGKIVASGSADDGIGAVISARARYPGIPGNRHIQASATSTSAATLSSM